MKSAFKTLLLLLIISALSQKVSFAQDKKQRKTESDVVGWIANLPGVIKADNYCIKKTQGRRHLITYITGRPGKNDNYYSVSVAEDNGVVYHNWFNFLVDAKTYTIWYFDTVNDKKIPLNIWRKKKNYLGLN